MEKPNSYTSSFKQFFKVLFIILLVVAGVGFIINEVFERKVVFAGEISGASKVNRILNVVNEEEVPIFGSSRAQGTYVPSILGEEYYNYGIDGIQAFIWLFFLEKELEKNKTSHIIINFDLSGLTKSIGDVGNYIPNYPLTKRLLGDKDKVYFYLPLIKYFGMFESYSKYFINEKMNLTKHTDRGGSFEKNKLTAKKFEELVIKRKNTKGHFNKDPELDQRFRQLISSTDRQIYLVIAPYHASCFEQFDNLEEADAYLASLSQFENVTILDFRDDAYEDALYMNTTHLNYEGAKQFSQKLKGLLSKSPR